MGRSTPLRRRLPGDGNVPLRDEKGDDEGEEDEHAERPRERGRDENPLAAALRRVANGILRLLRTSPRARAGVHLVGLGLALMHVQATLREAGRSGWVWDA